MSNTIIMKKFIVTAALLASGILGAQAQTDGLKIGYTNVNYIFSLSPRSKEIESEIKTRTQILQKEVEKKEQELQAKFQDYEKTRSTMMESIRADKENELRNLEQSIMNLRKNADGELRNKYEELVAPESEKISKAVKDVAKENGYTYIMNGDPQVMLFGEEKYDVTDLVLKKLGITPPAPGSESSANPLVPKSSPSGGSTSGSTGGSQQAPAKRKVPNKK